MTTTGESIYDSLINEGRDEGRKEGIDEGRKEGRKEGLDEGRKEGREETLLAMVRNMRENEMTVDKIVRVSGLEKKRSRATA